MTSKVILFPVREISAELAWLKPCFSMTYIFTIEKGVK